MKLFWKSFISMFVFFVIIVSSISYIISARQIADMEKGGIGDKKILGSFLSKEAEVGYFENKWPFESLKKLSNHKGVLFWWIVREDGTIHLADNESFMGTYAQDYFPRIARISEKETVSLNRKQNYGVFHTPLETGKKKWSFWFGFSLQEISDRRKGIIILITAVSLSALFMLGVVLYFSIRQFTKPIKELTLGAERIGKGDLTHRIMVVSEDELGRLSHSSNKMAEDPQKTTVSKDYMDKIIETMSDALIVFDPDEKIRTVNKAACNLSGYMEEELTDNRVGMLLQEEGKATLRMEIDELMKEGKIKTGEISIRTKEGRTIPVLFSGSVMRDNEGHPLRIVCTGKDITERKLAEQEKERLIEELQKALSKVKQLSGLLPICASCKKVRDDSGYWNQIEEYIHDHSEAEFSHSICPECTKKLYPDL